MSAAGVRTRRVRSSDPATLYLASFLVVGLSVSVLGPALTDLRDSSGSGVGSIGSLFAAQSLGYLMGSFLAGRLLDRVRPHRFYAVSILAMGASLALIPSLRSLGALAAVFVVLGTGGAAVDVAANTLLVWSRGAAVGRAMNLLHLCFGLGALTAPLFVHVGLAVATRAGALATLVIALWALGISAPAPPAAVREEHTDATPRLLGLAGGFFFLYVGLEIGFAGWIFTYGEDVEFSATAATWLTTTFWIAFTLGRLAAAGAARRVRPRALLAGSTAGSVGAALVLVAGGGRAAPVWVGTALCGLAMAPQFPVMITYLERRIPLTGSATSWFVGGAGLGGLLFPFLIGQWFSRSGATALPLATLLLAVATTVWFARLDRLLAPRTIPVGTRAAN